MGYNNILVIGYIKYIFCFISFPIKKIYVYYVSQPFSSIHNTTLVASFKCTIVCHSCQLLQHFFRLALFYFKHTLPPFHRS